MENNKKMNNVAEGLRTAHMYVINGDVKDIPDEMKELYARRGFVSVTKRAVELIHGGDYRVYDTSEDETCYMVEFDSFDPKKYNPVYFDSLKRLAANLVRCYLFNDDDDIDWLRYVKIPIVYDDFGYEEPGRISFDFHIDTEKGMW